jgi:hypothetical protein
LIDFRFFAHRKSTRCKCYEKSLIIQLGNINKSFFGILNYLTNFIFLPFVLKAMQKFDISSVECSTFISNENESRKRCLLLLRRHLTEIFYTFLFIKERILDVWNLYLDLMILFSLNSEFTIFFIEQ